MTPLGQRFHDFWFEPGSPLRLGVARAVFFGGMFVVFLQHDFTPWGDVGAALWQPVWVISALGLPPPTSAALGVLQILWKGALVGACLGLFTRVTTLTAFVLGLYLLGVNESWGKIGHASAHLVPIMAVLALAHSADEFSLDAWLRRRRGVGAALPSGEHTWPIRAAWLVLALMLFASGVAKVRVSGAGWASPGTLAAILLDRADMLGAHPAPFRSVAPWLASKSYLCALGGMTTLTVELAYPLTLVSRRARRLLLPATVLLFLGITCFLVLAFGVTVLLSHLAFWTPWDEIAKRRRSREA